MKLGMVAIAARTAEEHLTSKERFPPERSEALRVKVARVDGPESHEASRCAA